MHVVNTSGVSGLGGAGGQGSGRPGLHHHSCLHRDDEPQQGRDRRLLELEEAVGAHGRRRFPGGHAGAGRERGRLHPG